MEEYIKELKALLVDYDAFLEEKMPHTYKEGTRGRALRERFEALMTTPLPTEQAEPVAEQQE